MLQINGKTFMNLQEAVQWLLDNNALPFQSSANYVANTEIGLGTIVNPSPAKVRIGSLIFFADSKVSTVIGLTENGFIVSDQYNDLVDDIVYVSNVQLNASGHLIVTLSNGTNIDAGLIKQVSNFSINASQHLIANYNDGTSTDLGAIFQGNVNISGTLNATSITGDSIIENMSGYSATMTNSYPNITEENIYTSVCKNGNKITFVTFFTIEKDIDYPENYPWTTRFTIPSEIGNKLYPFTMIGGSVLDYGTLTLLDANNNTETVDYQLRKESVNQLGIIFTNYNSITKNRKYLVRYEKTFLLGDNLI